LAQRCQGGHPRAGLDHQQSVPLLALNVSEGRPSAGRTRAARLDGASPRPPLDRR
jgi:hypothetical protein